MDQINSSYSNYSNEVTLLDSANSYKPVIIACIPALNEELSIGTIILQTQKYVKMVVVCDDGSIDHTGELAEALGAYVIRHNNNEGKGSALRDLFSFALELKPDVIVVIDADGQHNPAFIPRIVKPILDREADMVIGSRYVKGAKTDAPLYRRIGLFFLNRPIGGNIKDVQSGLRAFTSDALKIVSKAKANDYGVEVEQVALAERYGLKVKEVPVEIKYKGLISTSKRNPIIHGIQIIRTLLRLTTDEHPLLILGVPASLIFSIGILSGFLFLVDLFNHNFNEFYALVFLTGSSLGILIAVSSILLQKLSNHVRVKEEI